MSTPHLVGRLSCYRQRHAVVLVALVSALATLVTSAAAPQPARSAPATATPTARLANTAHLDFLRDTVAPREQAGHTTYRLDLQPGIGVLWTYAEPDASGQYRRIGGGRYEPTTDTYGQGAFNADDISRAAVAYVRHWRVTGEDASREHAYQLLRGLTYLQTVEGPNTGNVVLWMQPDGTLHPSAEPKDSPDPSDSGPSYWLARTVWALGEGYAAFRDADPAFAAFLDARMSLALDALRRQVLDEYGTWRSVDGRRMPAWLVVDGADATAEAMLGLSAYVDAGGGHGARAVLARFADGVAAMGTRDPLRWPFGAVLPWAGSRSTWHAWGGMAPAALAAASQTLGDRRLLAPAIADTAAFTTHLLAQGGPDNGWLPTPSDRQQIAYGADSRLQSLLAVAEAAGRPGLREVAGFAGAWYFGNNAAAERMYDPATGRTFDGVNGSGQVNRNSGAESTIHGFMSMLALDAESDVARAARVAARASQVSWHLTEAESGDLAGDAVVVAPDSPWTGESLWSGGRYVALRAGGRLDLEVDLGEPSRVMPVVWRQAGHGRTRWHEAGDQGATTLGVVDHGDAGGQGASAVPGYADVTTMGRSLDPDTPGVAVTHAGGGEALVDAVLVAPEVEYLVLGGQRHGRALVRSFADDPRTVRLVVPGEGVAQVLAYDHSGRLTGRSQSATREVAVTVPGAGFAVVQR